MLDQDTAVVLLNWNGVHWMQRFLPVLLEHTPTHVSIHVADNGSTDGSVEWLRTNCPRVTVHELGANHGFAGGYNLVLKDLPCRYAILINTDVEVVPGWLAPLIDRLERDPRMAACQPKVRSFHHRDRFEHAGAAGGLLDRNGYPFCRGRIFELTEQDTGQYDGDRDVFWATGACLALRMEAFRAVDGFDADLFAHMEEIDLCWRMRRAGWSIGFTSDSVVYHVGGGSLGYGSPRKTYLNFRNSLIVLTKNLRERHFPARLFRRLVLDAFAALKFLLEGHWAHFLEVGRAHRHFFGRLPRLLRERERLKALDRAPDLTGMYRRSIAYDRFILGWRRFTDLDDRAFVRRGE